MVMLGSAKPRPDCGGTVLFLTYCSLGSWTLNTTFRASWHRWGGCGLCVRILLLPPILRVGPMSFGFLPLPLSVGGSGASHDAGYLSTELDDDLDAA